MICISLEDNLFPNSKRNERADCLKITQNRDIFPFNKKNLFTERLKSLIQNSNANLLPLFLLYF